MSPDGEEFNFQFAEYSWPHRLTWCASHWRSCRLWRDVTLNLKMKDIDAATEAKHRLEEKQRAEARERKEKEQQWETRVSSVTPSHGVLSSDSVIPWHVPSRQPHVHVICIACVSVQLFHEDGECWVYDEPLLKRLVSQRHWEDFSNLYTLTHIYA